MKKEKAKGAVEVPKNWTAMFLMDSQKECKEVMNQLKDGDGEFVVASGIKILYRKECWDVVEA